jgi:hypothetical protein
MLFSCFTIALSLESRSLSFNIVTDFSFPLNIFLYAWKC